MLSKFFYAIRYVFWWLGNQRRRLGKPPDFVVFNLEGEYPQLPQMGGNPLVRYFRPPKISLWEIAAQIRTVAADPRVKGVIFNLRPLEMSLAKLDVIRGWIAELKTAGKRVIVWSYTYDTGLLYLAAAADDVWFLPGGTINPLGLYRPYTFLAEALEFVGLQADFVQITPYKSAADMFSRTTMSDEVRAMGNWLADATFDELINAIAVGRGVELETVKSWIDESPYTDLQAKEIGLVDELCAEEDWAELLTDGTDLPRLATFDETHRKFFRRPLRKPGKYVALMSIEGMIMDGRSGSPPVDPPIPVPIVMDDRAGDLSVVQTARQILADKRAAGVVVYVDSRGGSVTASERMRVAIEKIAAQKPVVVVMGPVAASGGYWVATPAKTILAQPNTLTGSIGVIFGKIAQTGLLEKLFIRQETITRGENIGMYQPEAPFTDDERAKIWGHIQRVYEMFLERVSASRALETEAVDPIAGGRVWTGRQALENGLIDELGGLKAALDKARTLAELDENAGVRLFVPGKQYLTPVTDPAAGVKYAIDGVKFLGGQALCLLPWVER
jgi:protease IV